MNLPFVEFSPGEDQIGMGRFDRRPTTTKGDHAMIHKGLLGLLIALAALPARAGNAVDSDKSKAAMDPGIQVPVDGGSLWLSKTGSGAPIVALHGGPGLTSACLRDSLAFLSNHSTLVLYDQRTCGRSRGFVGTPTVEQSVADLEAVRKSLGVERLTLLGHSVGGLIATQYALAHPDHVERLLLVSSMGPMADEQTAAARKAMFDGLKLDALRDDDARDVAVLQAFTPMLKSFFHRQEAISRLRLESMSSRAVRGLFADLGTYDLRPGLAKLSVPTLVLYGKFDANYSAACQAMAAAIPGAKAVELADSGHWPFLEEPKAFQEAVTSFLASASK